jgi:hypothetical protein
MRRSASEVIRNLEQRIAHLEGKTANKNAGLKIETNWYTGSPRDDVRMMTLIEIVGELITDFEYQKSRLMEDIEDGDTERGTTLGVLIDIGSGQLRINCGVDGTDDYQAGCVCCLWSAFVAAGLDQQDYGTASKKLASMIKSKLSGFDVEVLITKA